MIILAAALTAAIHLEIDPARLFRKRAPRKESRVECGITTIGYRFHGRPGQKFRYAGDEYEIPNEGFVELIASRWRKTYHINNRDLPLEVWPVGTFGFRDVPMPQTQTADGLTALPRVRPSAGALATMP